jgi:TolB protein
VPANSAESGALIFSLLLCPALSRLPAQNAAAPVGIFENHGDVGNVLHPGSVEFDPAARSYTVTGSGENMWSAADAFHFAWKKVSGDITLSSDVTILGRNGNAHRKAVLMVRQSLDAGAAYAGAALHGDGLASLQFRDEKGAATHEVQSNVSGPRRLRISKRGEYLFMSVAGEGEEFRIAGGSARVSIEGPFYVGIGVCAHDKDRQEKAAFSNLELAAANSAGTGRQPVLYSTLETVAISSTDRRVVYVVPERIEAPNWTPDGASLIFNSNGRLHRIPVAGGRPEPIDTGFATRNNNDHGISPDGTLLAISDQSQEERRSLIYVVPAGGGLPRRITKNSPSYWHGWSPDGKTLAFCGQRNGEFDVYTISADGGEETRLTTAKGLDDGPEYSPDGKYIYFNSDRTGRMQIWRMRPDGMDQEQITFDDFNNWFPHISPDGKHMVFLTYSRDVAGHPQNKDVMLRIMSLADNKITVLVKLFGGQGTINVPSWSPDSRRLSFVSYQLIE